MSPIKYLAEFWRGKSITRNLLNQAVENMALTVSGNVVDLGGTGKITSSYRFLKFSPGSKVISINLDKQVKPTIVADLSKKFPLKKGYAGAVLCLNTVHLILDLDKFFSEIKRIVKPGSPVLISFPLIWSVHNEPNDYWRFTPGSIQYLFSKHHFSVIKILPYGSRVSSIVSLFDESIPKEIRPIFFLFCLLGDRIFKKDNSCPIGFLVYAQA
jgi:SAM-dependent methyltransferase